MLTNLLLGTLGGLHRIVDVLHGTLDQTDRVRPLGLWVDTFLRHDRRYVPEHGLQLALPFFVGNLKFPFS